VKKLLIIIFLSLSLFAECDSLKIINSDWIDLEDRKVYTINKYNIFLVQYNNYYEVKYYDGYANTSSCRTNKKTFEMLKDWQTK